MRKSTDTSKRAPVLTNSDAAAVLLHVATGTPACAASAAAPEFPPWSSPAAWAEINRAMVRAVHTPGCANARTRELAGAIRIRLEALWPLLDRLCRTTCSHCPAPCCLTASVWFDFRDLLYWHLNDLPHPDSQTLSPSSRTCRYLGPRGCRLSRAVRPWVCTWYLCPVQTRRLRSASGDRYARVQQALQALKADRRRLEDRFIRSLVAGLPREPGA